MTSSQLQSEDVTDQVVDTDSRIATMRASIARLQELMAKSGSVSDIATVEAELTRREADLESLLALQKSLSQRVETATITVSLATTAPIIPRNGFWSAILNGWNAMGQAGAFLLVVVGTLLPWAALAALIVVPIVLVRRHRRRTGKIPPKTTPFLVPASWAPPATAPHHPPAPHHPTTPQPPTAQPPTPPAPAEPPAEPTPDGPTP